MDNEKTNEALESCRQAIIDNFGPGLEPRRNQEAAFAAGRLSHLLYMIQETLSWPAERLEKKFRWLGFIQGALWVMGIQSIEQSKRQNMPAGEAFKDDQHTKPTTDADMAAACGALGYEPGAFEE